MDKGKKEDQELSKIAVALIRAHYEPDNLDGRDGFLEEARKAETWFMNNGNFQIASYIKVLIGDDKTVFVPMDGGM